MQSKDNFRLSKLLCLVDQSRVEAIGLLLPRLIGMLPSSSINISRSATVPEITLADHEFNRNDRVDILIAGDIYPSVMLKGVRKNLFYLFLVGF